MPFSWSCAKTRPASTDSCWRTSPTRTARSCAGKGIEKVIDLLGGSKGRLIKEVNGGNSVVVGYVSKSILKSSGLDAPRRPDCGRHVMWGA